MTEEVKNRYDDARRRYGQLVDEKGMEGADARLVYMMARTNIEIMRKAMPHWTIHWRNRKGKWYLTIKGQKSYNEADAMVTYHFPQARSTSGTTSESTWRVNPNAKNLEEWDYSKW